MTEFVADPDAESEARRLQAVQAYGILDTPPELAYDEIVKIASYICDTPTALVCFMDSERNWFKANIGFAATEAPRNLTFCNYVLQKPDEVMVIPDARRDGRFVENPFVTQESGIRFYAGAPLVAPNGEALGTVCVIDSKPRRMKLVQIEALAALSRQVVAQLELRRTNLSLASLNQQLAELSLADALTCIPNRRAFNERIEEEAARARRTGEPLSLLMADIDGFKSYNDEFGHQAGDQALYMVAQVLNAGARPYDQVARYGGEEFAVILPMTNLAAAHGIAERLRLAVAAAEIPCRRLTLSIGVAGMTAQFDARELIRVADRALYEAKARGRNRVAA
jgi:diguanylate cyclase (GGDEF)-like protein